MRWAWWEETKREEPEDEEARGRSLMRWPGRRRSLSYVQTGSSWFSHKAKKKITAWRISANKHVHTDTHTHT